MLGSEFQRPFEMEGGCSLVFFKHRWPAGWLPEVSARRVKYPGWQMVSQHEGEEMHQTVK